MPDLVLVDTDVLIDAARSISEAVTCLEEVERQASLAISVVSQMELIIGCRNKAELRSLDKFLSRFQMVKLNEQTSTLAIDLVESRLVDCRRADCRNRPFTGHPPCHKK